jgi:prophage antirepressor-like protein
MRNELFNFNNNEVSVIINEKNEPMFVAKEVCDILGLENVTKALYGLDDDERLTLPIVRAGQNRNVNIITESGLYSLVLSSKKTEAKVFKKWVTSEVLPSIRKHGIYATEQTLENMIANPDLVIGLATQLKQEREEKQKLLIENKRLQVRDEFVKVVFDSDELIEMSQVAKVLKLPYGRNKLLAILREKNILFKTTNEPYQTYIEKGYFEIKQKFIPLKNKVKIPVFQTFATQKGLGFVAKLTGALQTQQNNPLLFLN